MKFGRRIENMIASFRGLPTDRSRSIQREPHRIDSVMETIIQRHNIGVERPEQAIMGSWKEIVGPSAAHRASPERINKQGALIVTVANSVLRQELAFQKRAIIQKIQALPGCAHVRDVYFRTG